MKSKPLLLLSMLVLCRIAYPQCTPLGNEVSYGTSDTWIGYVYDGTNFNTYMGYVNEGVPSNPNFDESFGGDYVNYNTISSCMVYTETFSVRYKLTKTFASGAYDFTVGADDGFRLSLDGGATWVINHWNDQSYTTDLYSVSLNGTYNMVLEYYENGGGNRVSFNVQSGCIGSGNPAVYGTGNIWKGYVYKGMNFDSYKGWVNEGSVTDPGFDESFGGDYVNYNTSDCGVLTDKFSVRYRLNQSFANSPYLITVGGDDGFRLSLNGGATWPINNWSDQAYTVTSWNVTLNGAYNMVLEYYENGGQNRVSFSILNTALPLQLQQFTAKLHQPENTVTLQWETVTEVNASHFIIQRSADGTAFQNLYSIPSQAVNGNSSTALHYAYTDNAALPGASYYRLQIVDKNGQSAYSNTIRLLNNTAANIKIFPTVINNSALFIMADKPLMNTKLELFDLAGKKVSERNVGNLSGQQILLPAAHLNTLASGVYMLQLSTNNEKLIKRLVIVQSH